MKIYIAGKITGDPDYIIKFLKKEITLMKERHIVMNPAILPKRFDYEDYMKICFAMVDVCDCIYLLSDWKDSKGAIREKEYAEKQGKIIMYEEMVK